MVHVPEATHLTFQPGHLGQLGGNDGSFLGDPAGGFEMAWETLTNGTATLTA